MSRTQVFLAVAAIVAAGLFAGGSGAFQVSCSDDQCSVGATTSLAGVATSLVTWGFVLLYPQRKGAAAGSEPVSIADRFWAFVIDYIVVLAAAVPVAVLSLLAIEAVSEGVFRWSFSRPGLKPTDAFAVIVIVVLWAVLFAYFYVHARIGRQTVGQYVLGFRLEASPAHDGPPKFGLNTLLGFIGLCAWPVSVFLAANRDDKTFWWNLRARTRLTRVA